LKTKFVCAASTVLTTLRRRCNSATRRLSLAVDKIYRDQFRNLPDGRARRARSVQANWRGKGHGSRSGPADRHKTVPIASKRNQRHRVMCRPTECQSAEAGPGFTRRAALVDQQILDLPSLCLSTAQPLSFQLPSCPRKRSGCCWLACHERRYLRLRDHNGHWHGSLGSHRPTAAASPSTGLQRVVDGCAIRMHYYATCDPQRPPTTPSPIFYTVDRPQLFLFPLPGTSVIKETCMRAALKFDERLL